MAQHTPGPWIADNSRMLTSINAGNKKHIAMVNYFQCGKPEFDVCGEEHEANARLIAAAPELLEAVNELMADAEDTGEFSYSAMSKARAAIAKAKGEQS